jgi:serine/threonine protein kinase
MASLFFFLVLFCSFIHVFCISSTQFIYPNFTASHYKFIDSNGGSFLVSRNGTFKATMFSPDSQQTRFYLCVIHTVSHTVIWSANREGPVSNAGMMSLTESGITITGEDNSVKWSTPQLTSPVSDLELTETGNLVLHDRFNRSLWESFDHPSDTVIPGQRLRVGTQLSSSILDDDFSTGNYRLSITSSDAILQWQGQMYWKFSMEGMAYRNTNFAVEYMSVTQTGLYLIGGNGSVPVIRLNLVAADFRTVKLDKSGQFIVTSYSGPSQKVQEFAGPSNKCRIPFICRGIGLCTDGSSAQNPVCSCPSNFHANSVTNDCVPSDSSRSLVVSCNSTNNSTVRRQLNSSSIAYMMLGYGTDYFTNDFTDPTRYGVNLSGCQDLCSGNCSCLAIFFDNSSGSCYLLVNQIGSMIFSASSDNDRVGYIKILAGALGRNSGSFDERPIHFPIVALVLLPFTGFILIILVGFLWWRRYKTSKSRNMKISYQAPRSSGDLEAFSIPGLPVRFDYEELELATENFKTHIGSGGFGSVYKGKLTDETLVAVKKITAMGVQGKKDFLTEIVIIGNIHHMNLVKLKGFCAQGRERMLVYEYMNRGSLDCTLFGAGPAIEWQERLDIALGTARGLAYLHSGCDQKIIHCDVKPENILLHDNFQAKISDFGLSKLLTPEQSSRFTTMRGTRGYLAPEWLTSSAISDKTDVYSYGMVLLELVSGRKNCSFRTKTHSDETSGSSSVASSTVLVYFPLLALEMHEQGRYLELADPRLEGRVTDDEVEKLVKLGLCCVHEDPVLRPSMVNVVGILEGDIPMCQPRLESLNFLRFIGRRFSEASMREEADNGGSVGDGIPLYPLGNNSSTTNTTYSYISSHQVSGPR